MTRSIKIRISRRGLRCCSTLPRQRALCRGLGREELDRAGVWDCTVEDEETGEAGVVVVDRERALARADGCLRDGHSGEAVGGVADQQVVRRVGGPGPAADDVDVWIVVAVDI